MEDDTADSLAHRVFEEEKIAYPEAIRLYQAGRLRIEGRRVRVLPGQRHEPAARAGSPGRLGAKESKWVDVQQPPGE